MKISVVTPSIRPEFLPIVGKCLSRQSEQDFQWLIGTPYKLFPEYEEIDLHCEYILDPEPEKEKGDYYNLNKCWNSLFKLAKGDLIVSIVDGLWFPPDTLEKLYAHYESNPKSCITTIGHQYDQIENGKPEHLVWTDPRARLDQGSYYEVLYREMELCIASFPRQAVIDVGGVDEEFDKYAALSEKEMMARMYKAGYKLFIDQTIEYRAIKHDRLSEEWDERYNAGWKYFETCMKEIEQGTRLKLAFLDQ